MAFRKHITTTWHAGRKVFNEKFESPKPDYYCSFSFSNHFVGNRFRTAFDPDEPVYAETAREMIKYNDYLSPRIFDNFWYDKPPMYYWLVAASIGLFGDGEAAARFPAALMAVATSVMLYFR